MDKKERLESLESIFSNVSNWLSFAEAKNGALLALNIAGICGIASMNEQMSYLQLSVCLFLLVSTFILLYSFHPNTKSALENSLNEHEHQNTDSVPAKNLLFFGDIAKYPTAERYLDSLFDMYYESAQEDETFQEKHYAEEIWINSKITIRKYRAFRWALSIDIIACLVSIVGVIASCFS